MENRVILYKLNSTHREEHKCSICHGMHILIKVDFNYTSLLLQFPKNVDLTATQYPCGWHIPLNENREDDFKRMNLPRTYFCISYSRDSSEFHKRKLQGKLGRFVDLSDE